MCGPAYFTMQHTEEIYSNEQLAAARNIRAACKSQPRATTHNECVPRATTKHATTAVRAAQTRASRNMHARIGTGYATAPPPTKKTPMVCTCSGKIADRSCAAARRVMRRAALSRAPPPITPVGGHNMCAPHNYCAVFYRGNNRYSLEPPLISAISRRGNTP